MSDAVVLLQELCNLARDLDVDTRGEFFRSLCELARARSNWDDRGSSSISFFQVIDRGLYRRPESDRAAGGAAASSAASDPRAGRCALSTKNRVGMVNLLTHTMLSDHTLLRRFVTESARAASAQQGAVAVSGASSVDGGVPAVRAAGAGMWACRSAVRAGGGVANGTAKTSGDKGVPSPIIANLISLIVDEDDAGVQAQVVQVRCARYSLQPMHSPFALVLRAACASFALSRSLSLTHTPLPISSSLDPPDHAQPP